MSVNTKVNFNDGVSNLQKSFNSLIDSKEKSSAKGWRGKMIKLVKGLNKIIAFVGRGKIAPIATVKLDGEEIKNIAKVAYELASVKLEQGQESKLNKQDLAALQKLFRNLKLYTHGKTKVQIEEQFKKVAKLGKEGLPSNHKPMQPEVKQPEAKTPTHVEHIEKEPIEESKSHDLKEERKELIQYSEVKTTEQENVVKTESEQPQSSVEEIKSEPVKSEPNEVIEGKEIKIESKEVKDDNVEKASSKFSKTLTLQKNDFLKNFKPKAEREKFTRKEKKTKAASKGKAPCILKEIKAKKNPIIANKEEFYNECQNYLNQGQYKKVLRMFNYFITQLETNKENEKDLGDALNSRGELYLLLAQNALHAPTGKKAKEEHHLHERLYLDSPEKAIRDFNQVRQINSPDLKLADLVDCLGWAYGLQAQTYKLGSAERKNAYQKALDCFKEDILKSHEPDLLSIHRGAILRMQVFDEMALYGESINHKPTVITNVTVENNLWDNPLDIPDVLENNQSEATPFFDYVKMAAKKDLEKFKPDLETARENLKKGLEKDSENAFALQEINWINQLTGTKKKRKPKDKNAPPAIDTATDKSKLSSVVSKDNSATEIDGFSTVVLTNKEIADADLPVMDGFSTLVINEE